MRYRITTITGQNFMVFNRFPESIPSLNFQYLFTILKIIKIPIKVIKLLTNLYKVRTIRLPVNKYLVSEFRFDRGLNQGCSLSPYLFNIGLIPLVIEIKKTHRGFPVKQYQLEGNGIRRRCIMDSGVYQRNEQNIKNVKMYSKASNIKTDEDKTQMFAMDNKQKRIR